MQPDVDPTTSDARALARRVRPIVVLVAAVVLACAFAWLHPGALFVLFAAFLFFVGARTAGEVSSRHLRGSARLWSVVAVFFTVALIGLLTYAFAKPFVAQASELAEQGPETLRSAIDQAWRQPWVATLLGPRPDPSSLAQAGKHVVLPSVPSVASGALDVGAALVVCFFVALYLSIDPDAYADAAVRLVPPAHRANARAIGREVVEKLGRWLVARGISMVVAFAISTVGLFLMKIPMWLALGVIAGLFTFVDYAGAIASGVPAILVALAKSPGAAAGVLLLYVGVHLVDGYLLTPWIVRRAVSFPPAFTLSMQLLLGAVFGIAGITFATPLSVVIVTIVRRAYVERFLGDRDASEHRVEAPSLPPPFARRRRPSAA
jgi:predicted PurR-regulated permease PerM